MPSNLHELLLELFRFRPGLAAELLANVLGVRLPAFEAARLEPGDAVDLVPTEYRADAVVVLIADTGPVLAVVVEIQLGRDADKRWSWPVYVATLRARLRCPVELLVVCPDRAVASWCAGPIRLGLGESALRPWVLGPDLVPVLDDPARADSSVELAVLSALAHGQGRRGSEVLDTMWELLKAVEPRRGFDYLGLVYAALPQAARRHLEDLVRTDTGEELNELAQWLIGQGRAEGMAEGKAEGKAEGEAEGEARSVLAILEARGIEIPEDVRRRIAGCTDLTQLDTWVRRAATADRIEDLER